MADYKEMLVTLREDELATLEDDLHNLLDQYADEIHSLETQIEDIWSEYAWYDSQTGDYNLSGNAYHYEENLQGEIRSVEEKVEITRNQLKNLLDSKFEANNDLYYEAIENGYAYYGQEGNPLTKTEWLSERATLDTIIEHAKSEANNDLYYAAMMLKTLLKKEIDNE
jgi:flagellar biosynthesis chaperone FliJ